MNIKQTVVSILVVSLFAFFFASCVKEIIVQPVGPVKTSTSIEFRSNLDSSLTSTTELVPIEVYYNTNASPSAFDTITIGFIKVVSHAPANTLINLNLKIDSSIIPSGYSIPSAGDYVLIPEVSSNNISSLIPVRIAINRSKFNYNELYALGIVIDNKNNNVTINPDANGLLFSLRFQNEYEGVYSLKGHVFNADDASKSGVIPEDEMVLTTDAENQVSYQNPHPWADGSLIGVGNPQLTIDNSNSVSVTSPSGIISNTPGYNSRYDRATRTFYISFTWLGGPTEREATDTLTFLRYR